MLKVGDPAPPIDAMGSDGKRFVLYEQQGLCTVIYFFPKAFTPGCTAETREFQKHYVEIALAGATLVGVSTDDADTQCRFATSLSAPFPILGDRDRAICRAYDVLWPLVGVAHRVTYVVAPADPLAADPRWTVEAVFHHELQVLAHRNEVLRFVNDKLQASRPLPRAR
jgi:thioredoxin-dependent peroxiredoxin